MSPYRFPVTCDVCGGDGVGTAQTGAAAWMAGSTISHRDPRICADNLARLKREADVALKKLAAMEAERDRWVVPA